MDAGDVQAPWRARQAAAYLAAAGLSDCGRRVRRLKGGYWNDVFVAEGPAGRVVVKRYRAVLDGTMFPNLPDAEHRALTRLRGREVAPDPVLFGPAGDGSPVLVYRFHAGRPWRDGVEAVARLMRRQHGVDATGFRSVPTTPAAIIAQAEAMYARCTADARVAAWRAARPPAAELAPGRVGLLHTDAGPQNLIDGPDGLRLIDWQCPAAGDPAEDLYSFLSPAFQILNRREPLDAARRAAFLAAYDDDATARRLAILEPALCYRMAAYCCMRYQSLAGRDEEAFRRYGRALEAELERMRSLSP